MFNLRELSLHLMDIVQNSIVAGATLIEIEYSQNSARQELVLAVRDNGKGMDSEQLEKVQSPFFSTRTTRKIGLGIPLFKMAAEATGGSFSIDSTPGVGTLVRAVFLSGHIDMVPPGDINETVRLLVTGNPDLDFTFLRKLDDREFVLDTREMRQILGDIPFSSPDIILWLGDYLKEQEAALKDS